MNTSSICGLPERAVTTRDTWAVPPDSAPSTSELVSITSVGDHLPPAMATPAGITKPPSTTVTATDPWPAMKKRIEGWVASTHVNGERADDPAGRDSEEEPGAPVAAYGSLPATSSARLVNVHVELSKSPPGESSYFAKSSHGINGWLSCVRLQALRRAKDVGLTTFACAPDTTGANRAVAPKAHAIATVLRKRRAELIIS